jgi:hypothetical protein
MAFKVKARETGYYGFKIREAGDTFHIEKASDYGSWMTPLGWSPPARRTPSDQSGDGDAKILGFKGSKPKYVEDDVEIDLQDAMRRAIEDAELSVAQWNELTEKERRARTMTAVQALIEEELLAREDEGEGDGEDADEDEDDKD